MRVHRCGGVDLAEAYLFMGRFIVHATDGDMSDGEWEALVTSFARRTRSLGYGVHDWQQVIDRTVTNYDRLLAQGPAAVVGHFRTCVRELQEAWGGSSVLARIEHDLRVMALADGHLHPMEQHFLDEVERAWRLRLEHPAPGGA